MAAATPSGAIQNSEEGPPATRTRQGRTAKIVRTREVIEKVVVEHEAAPGTPPVVTTAEQHNVRTTTMDRSGRTAVITAPGSPPSVSKRSRQTNSASAARQTESSGAVRREVPIAAEEQAPIVTPPPVIEEVDQEAFEEVDQTLVDPRMSTQDYLEEAENILDHPSSQEVVVAATDLPQAGTGDAPAPSDAAAAAAAAEEQLEETNAAAREAEQYARETDMVVHHMDEEAAAARVEDAGHEIGPTEVEEPAAQAAPGQTPSGRPASSSGIVGRIGHVIQSILHPAAGNHGRTTDTGGTEDDHAMQQATESIESGQPAEPEAAPASPKKRRGRPPKKPKTATDPAAEAPEIAATSPDAAAEPPSPEAVAAALPNHGEAEEEAATEEPEHPTYTAAAAKRGRKRAQATQPNATPTAVSPDDVEHPPMPDHMETGLPSKGGGLKNGNNPPKKGKQAGKKGRGQAKAAEEETADVEEPQKPNSRGRGRPSKQAPAAEEAVDEEEEEKTPEQETPPIAPVTPERRQKQPAPKPASKPAPKRRRVEEQEPVAEKESVRTSPRAHTQQLKTEAAPPPAKAAAPRKAPSKTAPPKRGKQGPVKTIKKERRPARKESYKSYILHVLKEIHPDQSISKRSMDILNAFTGDMFDKIVAEAARLTKRTNKKTLSSREIDTAVRLLLPGELGKHAMCEGKKAVHAALA